MLWVKRDITKRDAGRNTDVRKVTQPQAEAPPKLVFCTEFTADEYRDKIATYAQCLILLLLIADQ